MEEKIYVVGLVKEANYLEWGLVGVFWQEEDALAACRTENHFIGTITIGVDYGDTDEEFPDSYYPLVDILKWR